MAGVEWGAQEKKGKGKTDLDDECGKVVQPQSFEQSSVACRFQRVSPGQEASEGEQRNDRKNSQRILSSMVNGRWSGTMSVTGFQQTI